MLRRTNVHILFTDVAPSNTWSRVTFVARTSKKNKVTFLCCVEETSIFCSLTTTELASIESTPSRALPGIYANLLQRDVESMDMDLCAELEALWTSWKTIQLDIWRHHILQVRQTYSDVITVSSGDTYSTSAISENKVPYCNEKHFLCQTLRAGLSEYARHGADKILRTTQTLFDTFSSALSKRPVEILREAQMVAQQVITYDDFPYLTDKERALRASTMAAFNILCPVWLEDIYKCRASSNTPVTNEFPTSSSGLHTIDN